jgi:hypothetical protein
MASGHPAPSLIDGRKLKNSHRVVNRSRNPVKVGRTGFLNDSSTCGNPRLRSSSLAIVEESRRTTICSNPELKETAEVRRAVGVRLGPGNWKAADVSGIGRVTQGHRVNKRSYGSIGAVLLTLKMRLATVQDCHAYGLNSQYAPAAIVTGFRPNRPEGG